jgi:hypothetical protein
VSWTCDAITSSATSHRTLDSGLVQGSGQTAEVEVRDTEQPAGAVFEVVAIYPHRDTVPREVWLRLFGAAQREIGILDEIDMSVAADQAIADTLARRAESGVNLRICLHDTNASASAQGAGFPDGGDTPTARMRKGLVIYAPLREHGEVEIRLHQGVVYNFIYYTDHQMLVSQRAYGIPSKSAPVLHLQRAEDSDMAAAYSDVFEAAWAAAVPAE